MMPTGHLASVFEKETSHMASLRSLLIVIAVGLVPFTARAETSAEKEGVTDHRICTENQEELVFLRKHPTVRDMLKKLPKDHKIKPNIQYHWSDDEGKQIPRLVALTPVDAEGKPDGEERRFGAEQRIVPYQHGIKHGMERSYGSHGRTRRLLRETPWQKGGIHGVQKVYHLSNGKLYMEVHYKDGRRQGVAKTYDLPGRLVKVTPYRDDKVHGKVIEYYSATGQQKKVIPFHQGKVQGVVYDYYEDGSLKRELPATNDRFNGIEKAYDEKGQLIRTRYWRDDEIVTREELLKAQTN